MVVCSGFVQFVLCCERYAKTFRFDFDGWVGLDVLGG